MFFLLLASHPRGNKAFAWAATALFKRYNCAADAANHPYSAFSIFPVMTAVERFIAEQRNRNIRLTLKDRLPFSICRKET